MNHQFFELLKKTLNIKTLSCYYSCDAFRLASGNSINSGSSSHLRYYITNQ